MNAQKFFSHLPWLRRPHEALLQDGLLGEYEKDQITDTTPIKREQPLALDGVPREIEELFRDYDLSRIHMLWTSFLDKPRKVVEGWHFADMSDTRIVLVPSGRIEAYNNYPIRAIHGDSEYFGAIAESMEAYLEAMIFGAMIGKHFASGFYNDPQVRTKRMPVIQACTTIAGGKEYEDFWASVFGF
jgi:hypothetical protein